MVGSEVFKEIFGTYVKSEWAISSKNAIKALYGDQIRRYYQKSRLHTAINKF